MRADSAPWRPPPSAAQSIPDEADPVPAGGRPRTRSGDDDGLLATRAAEDRAAFGVLYDRYAARVYRYCYRRLGTRELAEDATSQVFMKALAALPSYRETGSFAGWLFAIAFSVTTDLLRAHRPTAELADAGNLPDRGDSPEELAIASEGRDTLRALISSLPDDQRRAVELRLAGLTGAEVAAAMGRSLQAVKMLQFRAISRLRLLLGVDGSTQDMADDR